MFSFPFRTALTGCIELVAFALTKGEATVPCSVGRTWTWTDVSASFMGPVAGWAGIATGPSAASITLSGARRALPPVHFTPTVPGFRYSTDFSPVCAAGCDPRGRNLTRTQTKLRSLLDAHREACGTTLVKKDGERWFDMMSRSLAELDASAEPAWYDQ